jgi:hypothetical protein
LTSDFMRRRDRMSPGEIDPWEWPMPDAAPRTRGTSGISSRVANPRETDKAFWNYKSSSFFDYAIYCMHEKVRRRLS